LKKNDYEIKVLMAGSQPGIFLLMFDIFDFEKQLKRKILPSK